MRSVVAFGLWTLAACGMGFVERPSHDKDAVSAGDGHAGEGDVDSDAAGSDDVTGADDPVGADGDAASCDGISCDAHALCSTATGIPVCTCAAGYVGDGTICQIVAAPGACDGLATAGVWENITPPDVSAHLPPYGNGGPGGGSECFYGVGSFVLDPLHPGTIILGTCEMGLWKSTDCGAHWSKLNTGANGAALDHGRQWTLVIDPVDPDILYTNSGYNGWVYQGDWEGNGVSGAFKSSDGGTSWKVIWPPADESLGNVVDGDFVGHLRIDPSDHQHLLLSFHAVCFAPHTSACIAESDDGGESWHIIDGDPSWNGGEGQAIYLLGDGQHLLWGSQTNGLWHSRNGGASWTNLHFSQGHGAGQMYHSLVDGVFYLGGPDGIIRSANGIDWSLVPNSGNTLAGLTGDGTTLYASRGYPWGAPSAPPPYHPFYSAPESNGQTWTHRTDTPQLTNGGDLLYDASHRVLYSSNQEAGFWRVVLP